MGQLLNHLAIFEFRVKPSSQRAAAISLPSAQALCFVAPEGEEFDYLCQIRDMLSGTVEPHGECVYRSCVSIGNYLGWANHE